MLESPRARHRDGGILVRAGVTGQRVHPAGWKGQRGPMGHLHTRRGGSWPNNQAEKERDQGGFIFNGRFVEVIRSGGMFWVFFS